MHSSVNGKNFKLKMRAEHIELLQSPWLIELGAFCLNFKRSGDGDFPSEFSTHFSFDVDVDVDDTPKMTLMLPDSMKLEYDLTCPICLVSFLVLAVIQRDGSSWSSFDKPLKLDHVTGYTI